MCENKTLNPREKINTLNNLPLGKIMLLVVTNHGYLFIISIVVVIKCVLLEQDHEGLRLGSSQELRRPEC